MGLVIVAAPSTQAVEFDGTGNVAYDRLTTGAFPQAANIGAVSFTIEQWFRATSSNNNTGSSFDTANIFWDRDFTGGAVGGEYIFSIINNVLLVSVAPVGNLGSYDEWQGSTTINDNAWHLLTLTYDPSTGRLDAYIDLAREISQTATSAGSLAWVSGTSGADDILELGGEKHEAGADLAFFGRFSEGRIRTGIHESGATRSALPTGPMEDDVNTIILWKYNEGSGTTVANSAGADSDLTLQLNGGSAPPRWVDDSPY